MGKGKAISKMLGTERRRLLMVEIYTEFMSKGGRG